MISARSFALFALTVTSVFGQGVITTVAGTDWLFPGNGRPALNAPLSGETGLDIAVDQNGNYYIADAGNTMVLRVGTDGIINVVAGNGYNYPSGDGGLAVNAGLFEPTCVAVDANGNVFIGQFDGTIRKVTPDGIIHTLAVLQAPGEISMYGIAVDSAGNVFASDYNNGLIQKVGTDGSVVTVAGGGSSVASGIQGTAANLRGPTRMAVDASGDLYIVETEGRVVRKLSPNGMLTTVAGGGELLTDGIPATSAAMLPVAVGTDTAGNLYILDAFTEGVRKVDTQGKISTIAGGSGVAGFSGDGGPAANATFQFGLLPAIAIEPSGMILITDSGNSRVRAMGPDGNINTVAGNGLFHFSGNGGPAVTATIDTPVGVVEDQSGNVYFAEQFMSRIRRVDKNGIISVYAGTGVAAYSGDGGPATQASFSFPGYLAIAPNTPLAPAGSLVVSDSINCAIRAIDPSTGLVSTIAGVPGQCAFNGNSLAALKTQFVETGGIDFDSAGDLVIADSGGNRIRVIFATGQGAGEVFTLAGNGNAGFTADGATAQNAEMNNPTGVRIHNGGVYFSDTNNNVVRFIDGNTLAVTTVAGNGKDAYTGDGGPATQASLSEPAGIYFDAQGNLYIADEGNSVIRKVDTNGNISTFAGRHGGELVGDGLAPTDAFIGSPADVFVNAQGNLLFSDIYFDRVREVLTNSPPSFQVTPQTLALTAVAGSTTQNQTINITSSIPGVPFTASLDSSSFLSLSSTSGRMPAQLQVSINPAALSAGNYTGTVTITAPNANPPTQTINISLTVTAAGQPSLSVDPTSFIFAFVQGASAVSQPLNVANAGGGNLSFAAAASGGNWLTVSAANGSLGAFGSMPLNITANPAGLGPGTYTGAITLTSTNPQQTVSVPVTMTVNATQQTILIPQTGLAFFAVAGGGAPPPQFFSILNTGIGLMPWTVSNNSNAPTKFISTFPNSGATDAGSSLVPQVQVGVDPTGLNPGTYYGTVQVTSPTATNSPQFVSVVLTVLPPGSALAPIVEPVGLVFTGVAGADSPGSQTVTVQSTNVNPINFTSGTVTADGGQWLTSLPPSGTVTPTQPANVVIQPKIDGLKAGVYNGSLTLSFSDGSSRAVSVLLVLVPAGDLSSSGRLSARDAQAACVPSTLNGVFTQLPNNFSIPAGYPGLVSVKITDDCANPMTSGGVTVTFDNGDPEIPLTSLKDGTWAATWTPQHPAAQITVTAQASIPNQNLKGTFAIKGGLQTQDQPPVIAPGGIVNAFSPTAQVLAPGTLVAVYGTALAQGQQAATSTPLPDNLAGASILIGGIPAPLLYSSSGQVNAQIPYGISVNTSHQVVISRGNSISVPQSITVGQAAPGVFGIYNPVGQQVNSQAPATTGDTVVIYATGLGEVNPALTAGSPAPSSTLETTVNPVSVTMGGIPAAVQFSGLTPGFVGLYQVNAVVPTGVSPGDQVPVIVIAGGIDSAPVTMSVR